MSKLYISDLDGTLLNNDSVLSDYTVKSLNKLIEEGMIFSIATARTPATVVNLFERVNIKVPVALMNGAVIYDIKNKKYIDVRSFEKSTAEKIIEVLEENYVSAFMYTIEDNYLNVYYKSLTNRLEKSFVKARLNTGFKTFIQCQGYNEFLKEGNSILFSVMDEYSKLEILNESLQEISGISSFCYRDIFDKEYGYLEIYSKDTSKAKAIERLCDIIGTDEIISFGDNINDLPMFEISKECYAVGNAVDAAKEIADDVIDSNEKDGVVKFLLNQRI
ncbi:Cof-type HAD-IIB family hydrolase [Clostridium polynesiense]|uniref:Cof-type HAD-IIB family hydrolase n=1 Tax=Clostridium polynesiense TaxID=1325933 RepID=UPI0005900E6D|nr:Cof-type HAD-IIB family hydrolase [Clostridium polynesiense]